MNHASSDGSAGDANYAVIGPGYQKYRQPEPEFAARIETALGDAQRVLNVGAGAGSYEPVDRDVTAVEPSESMRAQRPAHLSPAIDAVAENLPFDDGAFDAVMTTFSVHQWQKLERGLGELRRVSRGPIVILTCDPRLLDRFWLNEYAPEVIQTEARRYPSIDRLTEGLGGSATVANVPIPLGCVDGFSEAYYGRPEMLLDPGARKANSAWSFVPDHIAARSVDRLREGLLDGTWDQLHGTLRTTPHFEGSLVLITT